MAKKAINTRYGSVVSDRRMKRERKLASLLHAKWNRPGLTLKSLAKDDGLSYDGVRACWRRFTDALGRGEDDEAATEIAITDNRGRTYRTLPSDQEDELGRLVRTASTPLTHSQMRDVAIGLQAKYDNARSTRAHPRPAFVAGTTFITRIKRESDCRPTERSSW